VMLGSAQAEDPRSDRVSRLTQRNTGAAGSWVKKERTSNTHLSQGQVWENFLLVHGPPKTLSLRAQTYFPKVQGKREKGGAGSCCYCLPPVCEDEL